MKKAQDKLKRFEKAFKLRLKLLKKGIDPVEDLSWQKPLEDKREIREYFKLGDPMLSARLEYDNMRKTTEKEIEEHVKQLPIYAFTNAVRGFACGSIGQIICEAGNLSNYSNPAKLWKRMGLAVIDGKRQGLGLSGNAEKAAKHGYSPRRRSVMYTIGDALIKQNRDGDVPLKYRQLYLDEKTRQQELNPDMKPIHIHRRAQRKMEKELLKDFWVAWRDCMG